MLTRACHIEVGIVDGPPALGRDCMDNFGNLSPEFKKLADDSRIQGAVTTLSELVHNEHVKEAAGVAVVSAVLLIASEGRLAGALRKGFPKSSDSLARFVSTVKEEQWVVDAKALQSEYARRLPLSEKARALVPEGEIRLSGVSAPRFEMRGNWITKTKDFDVKLGDRFPIVGDLIGKFPFFSASTKGRQIEQFNVSTGAYNTILFKEATPRNITSATALRSPCADEQIAMHNIHFPAGPSRVINTRRFFGELENGDLALLARRSQEKGITLRDGELVGFSWSRSSATKLATEAGRSSPTAQELKSISTPMAIHSDGAATLHMMAFGASAITAGLTAESVALKNDKYKSFRTELCKSVRNLTNAPKKSMDCKF